MDDLRPLEDGLEHIAFELEPNIGEDLVYLLLGPSQVEILLAYSEWGKLFGE